MRDPTKRVRLAADSRRQAGYSVLYVHVLTYVSDRDDGMADG